MLADLVKEKLIPSNCTSCKRFLKVR